MRAYGPKCLFSSVKAGSLDMKASIGMTKAAVLPEPMRRLGYLRGFRCHLNTRTSLCYANDIPVLETDWNSLTLNCRRFLVADLFDDVQDLFRDTGFLP